MIQIEEKVLPKGFTFGKCTKDVDQDGLYQVVLSNRQQTVTGKVNAIRKKDLNELVKERQVEAEIEAENAESEAQQDAD